MENLNIVIMAISIFEGMAGTKRVRNFVDYLILENNITLSNLIIEKKDSVSANEISVKENIIYCKTYYDSKSFIQFFISLFKGWKFLKQQRKKYKNIIYYYGSPHNLTTLLLCFIGRFMGYRIIFDIVEDFSTFKAKLPFRSRIRVLFTSFISNHLSWFASAAIGISNPIVQGLKSKYHNKFIIDHIPVNFNPEKFISSRSNELLKNNHLKVFYGGSFAEKDGIEFLLNAFDKVASKISDVDLILSGKGNNSNMNHFSSVYEKCINKTKIHYLGFISDDEYYNRLHECDIFCMTRVGSVFANTGFPFKLAEFLATGKPVIVTNVGDVSKYLTTNDCMLIKPDSVEEISNALLTLLKNEEIRKQIGKNGKIKAYENFDSKRLVKKLLEIFYQM